MPFTEPSTHELRADVIDSRGGKSEEVTVVVRLLNQCRDDTLRSICVDLNLPVAGHKHELMLGIMDELGVEL